MKFLISGLGNIGAEYEGTRHNVGFDVVEALAKEYEVSFKVDKLASIAEFKFKGRIFVMIKPSTYMNLSGKALNYWMQQEKISIENILIVTDDLALPFGTLRLKGQGSDGGHNGLKSINEVLGTTSYARLRFGIGAEFGKGQQSDYVLGKWSIQESLKLKLRVEKAREIVKSFGTIGLALTMTNFNGK
jgi:PTH1 family peptidyl-tRNA hydrolase